MRNAMQKYPSLPNINTSSTLDSLPTTHTNHDQKTKEYIAKTIKAPTPAKKYRELEGSLKIEQNELSKKIDDIRNEISAIINEITANNISYNDYGRELLIAKVGDLQSDFTYYTGQLTTISNQLCEILTINADHYQSLVDLNP